MGKEVQGSASASLVRESEILVQNAVGNCSTETKKWLSSLKNCESSTTRGSKIQRVPQLLQDIEINEECYEPLVVSIGPYHHGKPKFEPMEKHKRKLTCKYTSNDQQMLETLYAKVMDVAGAARGCYKDDDESTLSKLKDEEFTRMMFLDGCFVLQFIYCYTNGKHNDLEMKNNTAAYVKRDLLLLENQLPFLVLKELMSLRPEFYDWKKLFNKFIQPMGGPPYNGSKEMTGKNKSPHQHEELILQFEDEPFHLLEYTRELLIGKEKTGNSQSSHGWSSYRSAKELKAVGIHFWPSRTTKLTDVKFRSLFFAAILNIPRITVDDSTKSMLLNLVAYEACPDSPDDFWVTSYICFLDSLIDHADDVKELRSQEILLNFLGSDQEVAELFNQIANKLVPNPLAYADVKDKIEKHYKNKMKNWLAEFWHTHFTSPWTLLAFIGAIMALVLSVIQTYESIRPPDSPSD